MSFWDRLTGGDDRPPAPDAADPRDVDQYLSKFYEHNAIEARPSSDGPESTITGKAESMRDSTKHRAEFPWLSDPSRGVRWDVDPIQLRNLSQTNAWVGMLVQSITKEVAETPWTIVEADGRQETQKRLQTYPEERAPIQKALPDREAERIYDLLANPNPDHDWQDSAEMWLADLLEVGSMAVVKAFPQQAYDGDELTADPEVFKPRALQTSAPEVWTKDYHGKTGILDGFWQFDDHSSPGSGHSDGSTVGRRGIRDPTFFDKDELIWSDMSPRSNRRYGIPPTLLVKPFLESIDLAVQQEQEYLSHGSLPSGAAVFEEWDRREMQEWKEENQENISGKPWKWLTIAGQGGDVSFEPFSYNFEEMQFSERQKWYARVIASVFQVPTAVVGIEPERVNYSTFQGERENFESNTLGPYLQKLERAINDQLIQPHWGHDYRFEFQPGMGESTRGMISERVSREFQNGIRRRNEARREIGLDPVDEAFDGFQDEVVEDTSPEGGVDPTDLLQSVDGDLTDKQESFDDYPEAAVENARMALKARDETGNPNDCGTRVGWERANQLDNRENLSRDTVERMAAFRRHEDNADRDGDGRADCGWLMWNAWGGDEGIAWAERKLDALEQANAQQEVEQSAGDSGNANSGAVAKDEPLRETDAWYEFDVQPGEVDALADEIAEDVQDLYDAVLSDAEIQSVIERLAADPEATDKSLSALTRRLREVFAESDIVARIERAIQERTAAEVSETVEAALGDADASETDIDIEAIREQLSDRSVEFADSFADDIAADIRDTVADGWAAGKDSRAIADDISEQADIDSGWQGAERIARQELHIAAGEARSEVAADIGKIEVWNTSGDDRVRTAHESMDGAWKRPGENWVVDYTPEGGPTVEESVPGDSEHGIGCRCGVQLRDRSEVADSDYAGDGTV